MMVLIGSCAIKQHFPDFREPKDIDYAVMKKTGKPVKGTELLENPILVKRYIKYGGSKHVAEKDHLYTLKLSHIFWPLFRSKHLHDIKFLRDKGCTVDENLFAELYEFFCERHGANKRIKMQMSNEDFFEDKVNRKFDHDLLHTVMNPTPRFLLIKEDQSQADVSRDLFEKLPHSEKLELIREEAYVLATERWIIPGNNSHWRLAYSWALKALISRLSPLWMGRFIAENYYELNKPTFNFKEKFVRWASRKKGFDG